VEVGDPSRVSRFPLVGNPEKPAENGGSDEVSQMGWVVTLVGVFFWNKKV